MSSRSLMRSASGAGSGGAGRQDKGLLMAGRRRERDFLRYVLLVPHLAEKVPEEVLGEASSESKALTHVVSVIGQHGVGNTAELVELLREGSHDAILAEFLAEIMNNPMPEADVEVDFGLALVHVEEERLATQISALMEKDRGSEGATGLTDDERGRLMQLLQEQRKLKEIRASKPRL